jgi:hypothetical protein
MKRVVTSELLDSDAGTAEEISASLRDLRMINTWFGGISSTTRLLERVAVATGTKKISLLEVAAGSGFVPYKVRERLRRRGIELRVTLLDRAASHLNGNKDAVVGDAVHLPFGDGSFDVVISNLFIHHLPPEQVVGHVNDGLRVCRAALIINDLVRDPVHLALVYAGFPLYRSRMTRNDAPASVLQAYTVPEIRQFLKDTTAARIEITRHYLYRQGIIAWKQ